MFCLCLYYLEPEFSQPLTTDIEVKVANDYHVRFCLFHFHFEEGLFKVYHVHYTPVIPGNERGTKLTRIFKFLH